MRANIRFSLLISLVALAVMSAAAQAKFSIIVPETVEVGEQFQVVYQLENGGAGSSLDAPAINGCTQLYGPTTSTQSSTTIINGNVTSSTKFNYTYTYRANSEGSFTVPQANITANGQKLTAKAKTFKVLPFDEKAAQQRQRQQQRQQQYYSSPFDIFDQFDPFDPFGSMDIYTPEKVNKDDIFVRLIVSKTSVYAQEAIMVTVRLYSAYTLEFNNIVSSPEFDGFLVEEVDSSNSQGRETYNGRNYLTADIKRVILFPQREGTYEITSGSYDITASVPYAYGYGIPQQYTIPEKKVTINVKPLPEPAPNGFIGAVGSFKASTSLAPEQLHTGEAGTLIYEISGTGNIAFIRQPEVHFPIEFEVYSPTSSTDTKVKESNVDGTLTVEYTFVPQEVGQFNIEIPPFVYFDPSKSKYVTIDLDSYELNIAKGANTSSASINNNIKVKNSDILHIHVGDKELSHDTVKYLVNSPIYWLAYLVALAAMISFVIVMVRRGKARADVIGMKMSRAGKEARRRLSAAAKCIKAGDTSAFYDSILRAVQGYMSDRLRMPVSEMSRDNITARLEQSGNSPEFITQVIDLIDTCEIAHYTPEAASQPMTDVYDHAAQIIQNLKYTAK